MPRSHRVPAVLLLSGFLVVLTACGDDDDGSGPDGFEPADLIGSYALSPAPEMTCDMDEFGTVTLTIDSVEVTDADEDGLSLRLPVMMESDFVDDRQEVVFTIPFDDDDQTFGGSTIIDIDMPAGPTTIHADGDVTLDGAFEGDDTFHASIVSDVEVAVGSETPTPCSSLDIDVTGTRS